MNLPGLKQRLVENNLRLLLLPLLLAVVPLVIGAPSAAAKAHPWLAFGDLRGYLEPCGCDPDSDLGGVKRIRALLENERLQSDPFDVYVLGNLLPPPDAKLDLKIPFLIQAIDAMQPDAVLLNRLELHYLGKHHEFSLANFVLANANNISLAKPYRETKRAVVTGFLSPGGDRRLRPFTSDLLAQWQALKKDKASDKSFVLLFAGEDTDLKRIVDAKIFDTVIRSNDRPFSIDPDLKEKEDTALLFDEASESWAVPLGGQGILRGGPMALSKAKSFIDIVGQKNTECNNPLGFPRAPNCAEDPQDLLPIPVSWLPRSIGGDQFYKEIFEKYAAATAGEFAKIEARRAKLLVNSPFAGDEACSTCHPKATAVWQKSAHAHAMATLQKAGKDKDWECVTCHSVGAKVDGGFASMKTSPHLANVQCETCHGPAKAHTTNPGIKPAQDAKNCESCHHQPHSSNFEFDKYWEKIRHGKESAMP